MPGNSYAWLFSRVFGDFVQNPDQDKQKPRCTKVVIKEYFTFIKNACALYINETYVVLVLFRLETDDSKVKQYRNYIDNLTIKEVVYPPASVIVSNKTGKVRNTYL